MCEASTYSAMTSTWIAKKMAAQFRAHPNSSYETIHDHLLSTYGVEVSKSQMYHAKKNTQEHIEGNHAKTYSKLSPYAEMVKKANPSSVATLEVERINPDCNPLFKRFF